MITTWGGWNETEEMLIPKVIGEAREGFCSIRRHDRMLEVGHRLRGYEE